MMDMLHSNGQLGSDRGIDRHRERMSKTCCTAEDCWPEPVYAETTVIPNQPTNHSFASNGVSYKGRMQKYSKNRPPPPCPLLSTLGHTLPSCGLPQTWLNTLWTVTRRHPVIIRCPWVTAVGTGRTQCCLQAVSGCCLSVCLSLTVCLSVYLSIYCLYL